MDDLEALDLARAAHAASVAAGGGDRGDLDHNTLEVNVDEAWRRLGRPENRALAAAVRRRFHDAPFDEEQLPDRYAKAVIGILGIDALPDIFEAAATAPDRIPLVMRALLNDLVCRHPAEAKMFLERAAKSGGDAGELAELALGWIE